MNDNMNWYQPASQNKPASKGVFTAFVENEETVNNYLVPAGGMAILIDLGGKMMYFKSANAYGMPEQTRKFKIEEIQPPTNANVVTRAEFDTLNQKLSQLQEMLQRLNTGGNAK